MKKLLIPIISVAAVALLFSGCGYNNMSSKDSMSNSNSMAMTAPFGGASDVTYAKNLWNKMEAKGLNSTPANLYVGGPPHGKVREVLEGTIDEKRVIVKRNYGGMGVTITKVKQDRSKWLKSVTIMAKREKGYDSADKDWFWVKYGAKGNILKNPKGMLLAGKVAKGMPIGCISCHASAPGGDFVYAHNMKANASVVFVK
jgi:hypothetical protein